MCLMRVGYPCDVYILDIYVLDMIILIHTERGCASDEGWITALDHVHSGMGHADDVYLVLSLSVGGFQGKDQIMKGKAVPVAEITFTFSTECTGDCSFVFMKVSVFFYIFNFFSPTNIVYYAGSNNHVFVMLLYIFHVDVSIIAGQH